MTREIKFRGWSKDLKRWIKGDLIRIPKDVSNYNEPPSQELKTFITNSHVLTFPLINVVPESVGQYTNYKDKKGVDIYENDIAIDKFGRKCIVVWHNEYACFALKIIDEVVDNEYNFSITDIIEVTGNTYENKELLQM